MYIYIYIYIFISTYICKCAPRQCLQARTREAGRQSYDPQRDLANSVFVNLRNSGTLKKWRTGECRLVKGFYRKRVSI